MRMIKPLGQLYEELRRLPGVGSKTALRLAYHIIDLPEAEVKALAQALLQAKTGIKICQRCFNLSDGDLCEICRDKQRDQSLICVVEDPQDVIAMERSHGYKGVYHVLHGVLSPLDGVGPDKLKIRELLLRLQQEEVKEIIIATNSDVEGEATASYLASLLKPLGLTVSRIAHGLPVGSDLEYADEVTLSKALENRRSM
ncbi:MAG: recombination mediator RecR [Acidaminococcaceae bacterium]|jgi:recombination protein RecR|nr:recombination mediator RecR [Acidaminococcaceae bacterium]